MEWSTSGQFLALGSFDDHVRVLSHLNWKPIADFDHEAVAVTMTRINKTAVRDLRLQYPQELIEANG